MRCLFLPDELGAFRPVAAALAQTGLEFAMLREVEAARLVVDFLDFDFLIVGANSTDSQAFRFLQLWKPTDMPALGVTCVQPMREELLVAGASRVVLLPDQANHLVFAIQEMSQESRS